MHVLIIGSGPSATEAADWPREDFDAIIVINNAWRIRSDWTHLIHPEDFPEERRPHSVRAEQTVVTAVDYVPVQNSLGGFVYAGGTMAFTAGYWALGALQPTVLGFVGCDMVYPKTGDTHFYGTGEADPLRDDITLQSLEAKAARLMFLAAERGCACLNYSSADESRLVFPRGRNGVRCQTLQLSKVAGARALAAENELGYMAEDGRYWLEEDRFDKAELARVDRLWLAALQGGQVT